MKLVGILILVGLGALVAGGFAWQVHSQSQCPGHWHASYNYYIDGHKVSFDDPHFYLEGPSKYGVPNSMGISSHVHQGDDSEWHFEPSPSRCVKLESANPFIGVQLTEKSLTLNGAHDQITLAGTDQKQAGTYAPTGNKTLTAYHQTVDNTWESISIGTLNKRQLRDGEKILVLYGTYSDAQVKALENAVPPPKDFVTGFRQENGGAAPVYPTA